MAAGLAGSTLAIEAGRRLALTSEPAPDAALAREPNRGATGRFRRDGQTVEREPVSRAAA